MHLAYPDDFWKKPITRKLQGCAIDSLARDELVEVLKSVDPKILPASNMAPLIAQISHRLVAGCLVIVQQVSRLQHQEVTHGKCGSLCVPASQPSMSRGNHRGNVTCLRGYTPHRSKVISP